MLIWVRLHVCPVTLFYNNKFSKTVDIRELPKVQDIKNLQIIAPRIDDRLEGQKRENIHKGMVLEKCTATAYRIMKEK